MRSFRTRRNLRPRARRGTSSNASFSPNRPRLRTRLAGAQEVPSFRSPSRTRNSIARLLAFRSSFVSTEDTHMTSDFLPNSAGELAGAETAVATDHSDFVLEPRASLPRTHVAAAIGAWLDKTDEERIARILSDIEIIHPTLEGLLNEADWLVLEPRRHRARGIVLTGPHGSGKSVYAKIVQARYPLHGPPADPDDRPAPKALLIQMSGARRTKAVLSRILEATKVPVSKSITISDRELLVVETLRRINCGVLILDEMQD